MPTDLTNLDFADVSPTEFASIVKSANKSEIAGLMAGPDRERVLAEVFSRMQTRFRPEVAGSLEAVIRWHVTGVQTTTYELAIAAGTCTAAPGSSDVEPRLIVTIDDVDFLKLVSGNASGTTLFMFRKLRAEGDIGLAAGLTRYFDIPRG